MKALKTIGIILLTVIVLLLVIGIFLPSEVSVQTETVMKAPPSVIFKQVNTMENWSKWSPFEEQQPEMVSTYEGIGVGAIQTWSFKNDSGSLTIIESVPYEKIVTEVDFMKKTKVNGHWGFIPEGDSTKVSWTIKFSGLGYPVGRYMGLIIPGNMKASLASGLQNIKELVENLPAGTYPTIEKVYFEAQNALVINDTILMSNVEEKMAAYFGELYGYVMAKKIEPAGAPFTYTYAWWDDGGYFAVGIPTQNAEKGKGNIVPFVLGPDNVLKATHYGPYDGLENTYKAIMEYAAEFGYKPKNSPWEVYMTDPQNTPNPDDYVTIVYFPVE